MNSVGTTTLALNSRRLNGGNLPLPFKDWDTTLKWETVFHQPLSNKHYREAEIKAVIQYIKKVRHSMAE